MSDQKVCTRIAPSPTGAPHIGTAYIALFNYAFARRHGGRFVLRIEDTDRARSTRESEDAILDALRWLGLDWDEGPDKGGPAGPYRQSECSDLYRDGASRLVDAGHAFPCFCTAERLAELHRRQTAEKGSLGYDGLCAALSADEARRRVAGGEPHVVRMRVPAEGDCVFRDRFRGEVRIPWSQVDSQILLKSDGFPTYHLASVMDDRRMGVTHVIRGEEWISSTPKHVLLYRHFGWTAPEFAHLPLLRNPDKSKLSKRRNPTSILYYRAAGFLPETLLNYLGLMAHSRADGAESFTLDEFVADFDLDRVSLGGPIFDVEKLRNFNARRLRELTADELSGRLAGWKLNEAAWRRAIPLAQPRLETLADMVPLCAFLFADRPAYAAAALLGRDGDGLATAERFKVAQWTLERTAAWKADALRDAFARLAERAGAKMKAYLPPFYVALSGSEVSLPLFDSMEILGRDLTLRRLQYALDALDAAGFALKGKRLKELEARFAAEQAAEGARSDT